MKKFSTSKPAESAKKTANGEAEVKPPRGMRTPQSLRGMRDILPIEQEVWRRFREVATRAAEDYGFSRIDIPVLEPTNLFDRSVGKVTDIVEKEMYTFSDKGGDSVTLRPEGTAGVVRAYIEHGLINVPQPVKVYYEGTMYRYQRPQYGRQREFHQWGFEVIGDAHPVLDAELMVMAMNIYDELGLPVTLQLNSIGDSNCRPAYEKALAQYYRPHKDKLCEACKDRLTRNVLRLLDCKEESCRALKAEAPQFVDHLCEPCKEHLMKIFEYLDGLDIPYVLNSQLVRGFDYYTRTVFEIWSGEDEAGRTALGGGGRYDKLVETLGGRPTAATGMSLGMETTIIKMREANVSMPGKLPPFVYIAQLGEPAKRKAMQLFEELRKSGVRVAANFSKDGLKSQMEQAAALGVHYTLIVGQKEIVDSTVIIRDMEAGIQEIFDFKKAIPEVQKKLAIDAGKKEELRMISAALPPVEEAP